MANPRGRPRKYFSLEEKCQADRDKSKRSHEKYVLPSTGCHMCVLIELCRHKDEINGRRRENYRAAVKWYEPAYEVYVTLLRFETYLGS
jgi:hypothetical protein